MAFAIEQCGKCELIIENEEPVCADSTSQAKRSSLSAALNQTTSLTETSAIKTNSVNVAKAQSEEEIQSGKLRTLSHSEVPVHAFTPGLVYDARSQLRESLSESQSLLAQRVSRECKSGCCNSTYINMKDIRSGCNRVGAQGKSSLQKRGSPFSQISPSRKMSSNRQAL